MTEAAIARASVLAPVQLGSEVPTDTTAPIYKTIHPVSVAASHLAATAEHLLFARSYLAAQGHRLDNVCRDINVRRLPGETDESLRNNAYKIFVPDSTFDTVVDPESKDDENEQVFEPEILNASDFFERMKAQFFRTVGVSDLPTMLARPWWQIASSFSSCRRTPSTLPRTSSQTIRSTLPTQIGSIGLPLSGFRVSVPVLSRSPATVS